MVPSATSVKDVICSNGWKPAINKIFDLWLLTHHALGPLIHDLHQSKFEIRPEVLYGYFVSVLYSTHSIAYRHNGIPALLKFRRDDGLYVCLLLEYKTRQKGNYFFWIIICKRIFENEFRED